ncbi:NTP transferase domain-containing protein [Sphingomonas sp. BIUV-7]|uniref:NTP transferase domain-containing protein n=1 Tax=Sphingomonas natans TaxID=3063330 RepID=A0ABT8Y991_9SPHN|nr:NTP transferase domain-containing protein [Sphingomonas sp. BIUV-7]MDO6414901.1 NTP transferase domain-containing protein [Sphingomonas sp. BIUV-7]
MTIAGILLAAGRSTRFGADDKLVAVLEGRPLIDHAAQALRDAPVGLRFVVRSKAADALDGFETVRVAEGAEMSRSLAAGIAAARAAGAEGALVLLADMPFVTPAHLAALVAGFAGRSTLLASTDGTRPSPPALFGADRFAELEAGSGDAGGRRLLAAATLIAAPPGSLRDIDTPEALAAARGR